MYLKFAKILAMGLCAVITTGMPSGMIQDEPTPRQEMQVVMPYEIANMTGDWYVEAGSAMKTQKIEPAVVVSYGVFEQGPELGDAPAPSDLKQKDLAPLLLKSPEAEKEPVKPITIPRLRVVVTLPGITGNRRAAQAPHFLDGQLKPDNYSGTYAPMQSDSYDYTNVYYAPIYASGSTRKLLDDPSLSHESSPVKTSGAPGKPGAPGFGGSGDNAATVVPEPAGFIAILAGLPGLTILTRRKKKIV